MKCKSCGKDIIPDEQIPGQWIKVCFQCWDEGKINGAPSHMVRQNERYMRLINASTAFVKRAEKD